MAFTALSVAGYANTSATWDEPMHLTAGYLGLARGDFRIDPSHPPLLRMWAAIPSLAMRPLRVDTTSIDQATPTTWLATIYKLTHRAMYVDNDADLLLGPARLMIVLLGVLLGLLVYAWAREWLGPLPALAALVLFVLEPNLMAHSSVVTTDLGVTTFIFGTVYFLWRTCRRLERPDVAAMAVCCGIATASKFSAVVLGPIVLVLLGIGVVSRSIPTRLAIAVAMLLAVSSVAAIWASYGFRYLPSASPSWLFDFEAAGLTSSSTTAAVIEWVDRNHLLPNAYAQGFLYTEASSQRSGVHGGPVQQRGLVVLLSRRNGDQDADHASRPDRHRTGGVRCAAARVGHAVAGIDDGSDDRVSRRGNDQWDQHRLAPRLAGLSILGADWSDSCSALASLPRRATVSALALLLAAGGTEFATAYPHTGGVL